MKKIIELLIVVLTFGGCTTAIKQETDGEWTMYSQKSGEKACSISVNNESGEVRWENEPPTLSQLAHYSDGIYEEIIVPKLNRGEALNEAELAIIACCLNVRMCKMNAANTMVLQSLQLAPEKSLTYGMVAHPKIEVAKDFGPSRKREELESQRDASERAFKEMLNELVDQELKGDSKFRESVMKWGETFSGNESVNFDKGGREKILRQILSEDDLNYRYLQKGFWYTLRSFFHWDGNTHKQPLPSYENQYAQRGAYIEWREQYQEDRDAILRMHDGLCNVAKENLRKNKDIQNARLLYLSEQYSDRAKAVKKADLLVFDYPFAVTLLECMRMMDYYDRNEWCNVTLNEVKDKRYKPLARSFVKYTSTLQMEKIGHAGLKRLYEKVYVPFLGNAFDMTSKELYCSGYIPFSIDAEFDLQSIKSSVPKDKKQSTMQVLLKEGFEVR